MTHVFKLFNFNIQIVLLMAITAFANGCFSFGKAFFMLQIYYNFSKFKSSSNVVKFRLFQQFQLRNLFSA